MMAQPTVVIVVDDNAGLLKSVARLLAHQNGASWYLTQGEFPSSKQPGSSRLS